MDTPLEKNEMQEPYRMKISLSILNHLGIGLYSNVPAVLSEIVANAWDADAENVRIDIDTTNEIITIYDDGHGMTKDDINEKYLNIGYRKRFTEPNGGITQRFNREPMGRKGIGKLSVFSIADIVEVYSIRAGERNALKMDSEVIKQKIESGHNETYHPSPLESSTVTIEKGTKIVLKKLKKNIVSTASFLRKRIAQRFSIIGQKNNFSVYIDGDEITAHDRDYYKHIEFVWHIGASSKEYSDRCSKAKQVNIFPDIIDENKKYIISGWLGTVFEQKHIDEESNTIVIFAHGKLVHENLLKDLKEGGIFSKYLIGEINADFLDNDPENDIITSARQNVKEDDPRFVLLRDCVKQLVKSIGSKWGPWRKEAGAKKAIEERPHVRKWYETLKGDRREQAKEFLGKIESLEFPDDETKKAIYKTSIVGFQRLALTDQLSLLSQLETERDFELFSRIFGDIIDLERVYYYDVATIRMEVIKKFKEIVDGDKKERVIQEHLFNALWLLDASWDRAATNMRMEERITTEFKEAENKLTDEEKSGRLDIRYQTITNKHVIVELKRYSAKTEFNELIGQITKYRSALRKALETNFPNHHKDMPVEVICVVGTRPRSEEPLETDEQALRVYNARIVTYDELIDAALKSYQDYLDAEKRVSDLVAILNDIDKDFEGSPE